MKIRLAIRHFLPHRSPCGLIFFTLVIFFSGLVDVQAESGNDEIFGGQILSLTEKKPELTPSNDPDLRIIMMAL